ASLDQDQAAARRPSSLVTSARELGIDQPPQFDFCPFWSPSVSSRSPQKRAAVMESREQTQPRIPKHGGSSGHYSQDGSAAQGAEATAAETTAPATTASPAPSAKAERRPVSSSCAASAVRSEGPVDIRPLQD